MTDNEYALDRMLEELEAEGYKAPERNQALDDIDYIGLQDLEMLVAGVMGQTQGKAYTQDISLAWEVLEYLHTQGWAMGLEDIRLNPDPRPQDRCWWYELYRWDDPEAKIDGVQFGSHEWELDGGGSTVPLCICQALIKTEALKRLRTPPVEGSVEDSKLE